MKFYIRKDILEGHEEAVAAYKELKLALAAPKVNTWEVTAARDYHSWREYLKKRIPELTASLEEFYPGFDPKAPPLKRDARWNRAYKLIWADIAEMEPELHRLEGQEVPDLGGLLARGAALESRIRELREIMDGFVKIEVTPVPTPEQEEIEEAERREEARIKGILELEGTREPGAPEGFVRVQR